MENIRTADKLYRMHDHIKDTGTWMRHDTTMNKMNKEHIRGDYFANGKKRNAYEDICSRTDEHMKHAKVQAKERRAHATSSKHQDHRKIHTLCHAEVKAMIHQEHIHHSVALQLNMHTSNNINTPALSC